MLRITNVCPVSVNNVNYMYLLSRHAQTYNVLPVILSYNEVGRDADILTSFVLLNDVSDGHRQDTWNSK